MNFNAYRTIQSMNALYNGLFIALPPPSEAVTE